jgi:branched-chain amino acid aminotransferase
MHRFILYNGEIHEPSDKLLTPGQVGLLNGWGVFSTIRVMDGVLFAFHRHWARMKRDAALLRVPFPTSEQALEEDLLKLVSANNAPNATLRVALVRNLGGAFHYPVPAAYDIVAFTTDIRD